MATSTTTKLTLSIPLNLVKAAKAYSQKTRQPLSRIISQYFSVLTTGLSVDGIPSAVTNVTGLAKSVSTDDELLMAAMKSRYLR